MLHKILFLPAFRIIAEMTVDPVPDIIRFANVYHFALLIMKIVDTGRVGQLIKMIFRYMRRQDGLFGISLQAFLNMLFFIICQQQLKYFYCCFRITTCPVPVVDGNAQGMAEPPQAVGSKAGKYLTAEPDRT